MKKKIYFNSISPTLTGLFILFLGIFMVVLIVSNSCSGDTQNIFSQLSPKEVAEKFCKLDAAGSRLSSDTRKDIESLLAWGEEGGYDEIIVIKDFKVGRVAIRNSTATVSIEYLILGSTDSYQFLSASNKKSTINFKLLKQNGLWRIGEPVIAPHVHWKTTINHLRRIQKDEPVRMSQLESIIKAIEKAAKL